ALIELQRARAQVDQDGELAHYLQQVSIILRRAAMTGLPERYLANLKGEAWLQWLDAQLAGADEFTSGAGRALLTGPYEPHPQADIEGLHQLATRWITQHRNQWQSPPKEAPKKSAEASSHASISMALVTVINPSAFAHASVARSKARRCRAPRAHLSLRRRGTRIADPALYTA